MWAVFLQPLFGNPISNIQRRVPLEKLLAELEGRIILFCQIEDGSFILLLQACSAGNTWCTSTSAILFPPFSDSSNRYVHRRSLVLQCLVQQMRRYKSAPRRLRQHGAILALEVRRGQHAQQKEGIRMQSLSWIYDTTQTYQREDPKRRVDI